jgi:hypothetical protein
VLQRVIGHVKLTPEQLKQRYLLTGVSEHLADLLVHLESETAKGSEEKLRNDFVQELTGNPPQSLEDWIKEKKSIWE